MNRLLVFSVAAAIVAACSANGNSTASPSGGSGGGAGDASGGMAGIGGGGSDGGPTAPPTIVIGPGADASSPTKFGGPDDASAKPSFVYPASGVVVPPNMNSLEIHWMPAAGQTLFELTFEAPSATLVVYTGCQPLGGGCFYAPDQTFWAGLVSHAKGTPPVHYHLRGVDGASPGAVGTSDEQTIAFTAQDLDGGLYYWNASGVIQRVDFGIPGAPIELYMNALNAGAGVCVGCHVLSRDGKEMTVGKDLPAPAPFTAFDVATKAPLMAGGQPLGGAANFLSFSPDGKQLLTSDSVTIGRRDVATGAVLDQTIVPLGTMPDWSPNGTAVAFAQPAAPPPFNLPQPGVDGASIAVVPFDGNAFGPPSVLVPFAGQNNYYPAWAPDSNFVAFNRSPSNLNSYDAADGQLWAVSASGGPAFQLANATGGAACSWPKWAPNVMTYYGGTIMFLTFSSRRNYGLHPGGTSQIWMTAFDVSKGAHGEDASTPAFWLPAQDMATGNHIAQWVTKVERKPCKTDVDCDGGLVCRNDVCVPNVK